MLGPFGKEFTTLEREHLSDLETLERERAIYTDHWIDEVGDFRHVRIPFTQEEIAEYVRRVSAFDLFLQSGARTAAEVAGIPEDIASDADTYTLRLGDGRELAPWYCLAAFLGPHLEALTCTDTRRSVIAELATTTDGLSHYGISVGDAVARGEGQTIEFKVELDQARDLAKEVAAFSTSGDGVILLGVDDDGGPVGTDESKERLEGILRLVNPLPTAAVEFANLNDTRVAAIRVKKGTQPIYYVEHRPYLRQGSTSRPATAHEVYELIEGHIRNNGQ